MFPHHVIVGALSRHPPLEPPAKRARHSEVSSSAVDEALNSRVPAMVGWLPPVIMQCFGPNANVLTNVLWLDKAPSHLHQPKKYVKHQAFKKKLSNMCPQVRSTGIGHKTSSFSRPRCLRQGLHCTQEGPQSLHVVCSPRAKQVSIFCRTLLSQ